MKTPAVFIGEETREQLKAMYGTAERGKIIKQSETALKASAASCLYNYLIKQGSPREQMEALGELVDALAIPYLLRTDETADR